MSSYKLLCGTKLYPGSTLQKGLEFVLSLLQCSRTKWGKFLKYKHLLKEMTLQYEERHSGDLWKQLPSLQQEDSSQKALPSTGQCLPEQAWREHPGTLLCCRLSMKHVSTCCLSDNEFLVSGVRNPENCEAESCMEQGELWIAPQRARERF